MDIKQKKRGDEMSMRKIYRQIARKHGIPVSELKRDMQEAINIAYLNSPDDGVTKAYQNRVPRKGQIPTTDEFIRYAAETSRKNNPSSE